MTAEQDLTASEESVIKQEAGTILKRKREELGYTQKQIADRLRLRPTVIENIENNQFASDQVATFTRGYLKSYAKLVGIDEEVVLGALHDNADAQHKEQKMKSFSRQTKREKHDSRIMTLTWGIFAIIIAISVVWVWQNQVTGEMELTSSSEQQLEIEAEQQAAQLDVVTEPEMVEAPVITETESLDIAPVSEELEVTPATSEPEVEPIAELTIEAPVIEQAPVVEEVVAVEPAIAKNLLVMAFTDDCWIQVKDTNGKTLATGVKKAGQSVELEGEMPYKLILGAPENVSMTLASEPVDLSGYTSGKVAKFTLP
jgi:cytoskeleton protein RodZ